MLPPRRERIVIARIVSVYYYGGRHSVALPAGSFRHPATAGGDSSGPASGVRSPYYCPAGWH